KLFPHDDAMRSEPKQTKQSIKADVTLAALDDRKARFTIGTRSVSTTLELSGIYNVYNAAAALALVRVIVGKKANEEKLIDALAHVTPAFGRGESLQINGQPLEIVLVKNPSGFRLSLSSFDPK